MEKEKILFLGRRCERGRLYLGQAGDNNVRTLSFALPELAADQLAYVKLDLLTPAKIRIYEGEDGWDWLIGGGATESAGEFGMQIELFSPSDATEPIWNSEVFSAVVGEGLAVNEELAETGLSDLQDAQASIASLVDAAEDILDVRATALAGGYDGATFTPSVDSNGNLSWTNDKSLENPATMNIKGAGIAILSMYATRAELEAAVPSPAQGDAYAVGTSELNDIYCYSGTQWMNLGPVSAHGVPSGGAAGAFLKKSTAADYAAQWGAIAASDVATGELPVARGGTGAGTAEAALGALGAAAASHTHAQTDVTGLDAALEAKAAASHTHAQMDITGVTPISQGGTGQTAGPAALAAMGITISATDLTAGSSALPSGEIWLVYE